MKQSYRVLLFVVLIGALLSACAGEPTPSPATPISSEQANSPTSLPASTSQISQSCQPNRAFLDGLAASLEYEQAEIVHQSFAGEQTLTLWLVAPGIDQVDLSQKPAVAQAQAFQAAKTLWNNSPCLSEFNNLQFSVVDPSYQLWFTGSLRTVDLAELEPEQTGGGSEGAQGGGREETAGQSQPAPDEKSCPWPRAANKLRKNFTAQQPDAVFYFVRDTGGDNIYAQWSVPDRQAAQDVIDSLTLIADQVICLHPPINGISLLLTLPDGQVLLTGYLPLGQRGQVDPAAFSYNMP